MRRQVVVLLVEVLILGLGRGCVCSMVEIGWVGHTLMYGDRARALCSRSSGSRSDVERPTC